MISEEELKAIEDHLKITHPDGTHPLDASRALELISTIRELQEETRIEKLIIKDQSRVLKLHAEEEKERLEDDMVKLPEALDLLNTANKALRFYANKESYKRITTNAQMGRPMSGADGDCREYQGLPSVMQMDCGKRAREALNAK